MGNADYRSNVEEFLKETEWQVSSPIVKARILQVLCFFSAHVPASELDRPGDKPLPGGGRMAFRPSHGRFTILMSWMQNIDFERQVDPQFSIAKGDRLVAYRYQPVNRATHRFGNYYALLGAGSRGATARGNSGLGIPSTQNSPVEYVARCAFTTLATTAGDAFLSWVDVARYPASYSRGGRQQLFIWQPERLLEPQVKP